MDLVHAGRDIYVDVNGWHLYLRDITAGQDLKLNQALAQQIGSESGRVDLKDLLSKIPLKIGGGKVKVSLYDAIPSFSFDDLESIVKDYERNSWFARLTLCWNCVKWLFLIDSQIIPADRRLIGILHNNSQENWLRQEMRLAGIWTSKLLQTCDIAMLRHSCYDLSCVETHYVVTCQEVLHLNTQTPDCNRHTWQILRSPTLQ